MPWSSIRAEIAKVASGEWDRIDNPLHHAPHTAASMTGPWEHGYSREVAAYPVPALLQGKYWSPVARIDGAYGDRNLVCSCPAPVGVRVITPQSGVRADGGLGSAFTLLRVVQEVASEQRLIRRRLAVASSPRVAR